MITEIQTVLGASQFSGAGASGLITFGLVALPLSLDIVPVVTNIAVRGNGVSLFDIECFLQRPSGTSTERLMVLFQSDVTGFELIGCRIPVPRDHTQGGLPAWELHLITTNKTIDVSLIVSYEASQAVIEGA